MSRRVVCTSLALLLLAHSSCGSRASGLSEPVSPEEAISSGADLPQGPRVEVVLPDYLQELRAFEAEPPDWNEGILNAGRGTYKNYGYLHLDHWLQGNWIFVDYFDRSYRYSSHEWLAHRGIFYEASGFNEYQESRHFREEGALELFAENGIARDLDNQLVLDPSWSSTQGYNSYIVNNNAPRWWSVINYDWLTSPLLGDAISQDNIGAPMHRIGAGGRGRYGNYNSLKFFQHLKRTGRLREFCPHESDRGRCGPYASIRDYVNENPKLRKLLDRGTASEALRIARDYPVMAEYQLFQHLAQLHAFMRSYRDVKLVAQRNGRAFSVHGNQGGSYVGPNPYQVMLSDFVDTIWFETGGTSQHQIFKQGWSSAWGPLGHALAEAMARGRKPVIFTDKVKKRTSDLMAHEWAETSADGGVLFFSQADLAQHDSKLMPLLSRYVRFREEHRAIFERRGRRRHAQVGVVYSVPTFLYSQHSYDGRALRTDPARDLGGVARALEEAHVPYDVIVFDHPDLRPTRLGAEQLGGYRVLVLPSVLNLSSEHIDLLRRYVAGPKGGKLVVIGDLGRRDEYHRPVEPGRLIASLRKSGWVMTLREILEPLGYDRASFGSWFTPANDPGRRARLVAFSAAVREAVGQPLIQVADPGGPELPGMLWIKTWRHEGGLFSAHFVNYDIDYVSGKARATSPVKVRLRLPQGVSARQAAWLVPGSEPQALSLRTSDGECVVTVPGVHVYGVLVVGGKGLDTSESLIRSGDRYLLRARYAGQALEDVDARIARLRGRRSQRTAGHYAHSARGLLEQVQVEADRAFLARVRGMGETRHALRAFDFGEKKSTGRWQPVSTATIYAPSRGYGWLESLDPSSRTPEERYYAHARDDESIRESSLPYGWPYEEPRPRPTRRVAYSGKAQRFRIDLEDGLYRVGLIQANGSYSNRNYLVSGMTFAQGLPVLFDVPLQVGALLERSFVTRVEGGSLELTFGGPTGWGIAGLTVYPVRREEPDPIAAGGIRSWWVSPRYANPDWYPIERVRAAVETNLASPPLDAWTQLSAAPEGLPLVDLGARERAAIGDVVYAAAVIERDRAASVRLSLGASSAAMAWLNGERVAYLPNLKGVLQDEASVELRLREGRNVLVLKLARFWERRWLFYASLLPLAE